MDPRDAPTRPNHGVPLEPRSRREFLKAAVVGGTAVATGVATGAAGIVLSSNNNRSLPQILSSFGGASQPSGGPTFSMCITGSDYKQYSQFDVHSSGGSAGKEFNPGTLFVWITAHNLPADNSVGYRLDITMDITGADPTSGSTPFQLKPDGNGNDAFLFKLGAGAASDCPSASPGTPVLSKPTEAALYASGDYKFSTPAHADLQQYVHIVWDGGVIASDQTYTFSGTVKQGATTLKTLTSAVSITAHPA